DERRDLATELLRRPQGCAVQLRLLAGPCLERHLERDADLRAPPLHGDAGTLPAESEQLRVGPRARREALGADVQRLEEVRLADAVRADRENEAGREGELEPLVRPEGRQLDRGDDQPGRRIGMTRYVKSS